MQNKIKPTKKKPRQPKQKTTTPTAGTIWGLIFHKDELTSLQVKKEQKGERCCLLENIAGFLNSCTSYLCPLYFQAIQTIIHKGHFYVSIYRV